MRNDGAWASESALATFLPRRIMARPPIAPTATMTITPMLAHPMATTVPNGSTVAFLSEPVRGTDIMVAEASTADAVFMVAVALEAASVVVDSVDAASVEADSAAETASTVEVASMVAAGSVAVEAFTAEVAGSMAVEASTAEVVADFTVVEAAMVAGTGKYQK